MNWVDRMNHVIEYIEDNLTEKIDYSVIARLACCSVYNLQRVFSFLLNIPLSEYIRNRRLTEAAERLRQKGGRVLDIAVLYQYESQEAFTRAFIKFHGVTPASVKKRFCRLSVCPKAAINQNHDRRNIQMSEQSLLLERTEPLPLFYRGVKGPGTLPSAMSMWSFLEFLGLAHDTQQTYTILAGLIGELYSPPVSLPPASGVSRMLSAMGFEHEVFTAQKGAGNYLSKEAMTKRITACLLETRKPLVIITQSGDWCFGGTVIGYEHNGETLINWGYFPFDDSANPQPILTPNNEWYDDSTIAAFIGERKSPADLTSVYRAGVEAAFDDMANHYQDAKQRFFSEWLNALRSPLDETIGEIRKTRKIPCAWVNPWEEDATDAELVNKLLQIVDPLWCDYAERRFYAAQFLKQAAAHLPQAADALMKAHDAFDRIHTLMGEYIKRVDLEPGAENINMDKFNNPAVRGEMADIVEQCRLEEQNAAQYIKDAALIP
ncbi:MAG: AraC family transcriptional regulator [Oscillospiraceae bacterium]|nr:AraC family transcriptional regulator [Oscillospiraceae bacterium]